MDAACSTSRRSTKGFDILGAYNAEGTKIDGGFFQAGANNHVDIHEYQGSGAVLENFRAYDAAVERKEVRIGHMFVTENRAFEGPKWLINFPTKKHWRQPSKLEWVVDGLKDLRRVRWSVSLQNCDIDSFVSVISKLVRDSAEDDNLARSNS